MRMISTRNRLSPLVVTALALIVSCTPPSGSDKKSDSATTTAPANVPSTLPGTVGVDTDPDAKKDETPISKDDKKPTPLTDSGTLQMSVLSTGTLALDTSNLMLAEQGQASATDLISLKYQIGGIDICHSLDVHGSGHSNPQGCITIYQRPTQGTSKSFPTDPNGDLTAFTQGITDLYNYAKATTEGYVDLADPTAAAQLSANLKLDKSHINTYNYGVITWLPAIKVKASVPLNTGVILKTKDAAPVVELVGNDNYKSIVHQAADLTVGDPEEGIIVTTSGGNWFAFVKPLVITADDIKNKVNFKLDLTFDPDNIVEGGRGGNIRAPDPLDASKSYGISVPLLALAPIAHKVDEKLRRENYLVHVNASSKFDIRVRLFYVAGDADKTIRGVELQRLFTPETTSGVGQVYGPHKVTADGDNVEFLLPMNDSPDVYASYFSQFKRLHTVAEHGTMKFREAYGIFCLPGGVSQACFTDPTYESLTDADYELVSVDEL